MTTLADLERVERELRNDGSSYMGDQSVVVPAESDPLDAPTSRPERH